MIVIVLLLIALSCGVALWVLARTDRRDAVQDHVSRAWLEAMIRERRGD